MHTKVIEEVDQDRRKFLAAASLGVAVASTGALLPSPLLAASQSGDTITPFHVHFSDETLKDLHRRVLATRWPDAETVKDHSQGVQLATIKKLADHWAKHYDWRKIETKLNSYPQFTTKIDGLDIHFIHFKSKHTNALPILVTHGWPGSIIEQLKIIEPLTDPTAHGGSAEDAFHVVIPSLPGYGFSGKPTEPGWNPPRIAKAWAVLMQRLGYTKYVAQGGDWGNAVTELMAVQEPPGLLGIHTNMAATVPADISKALSAGSQPTGLSPDEKRAWDQLDDFYKNGLGYAIEMNNRPQTLYGIVDSPIGLASWMLDHDIRSYDMIARVFDGKTEGLTKDDILDNITLYWLTNTAISSARLYWDNAHFPSGGFFDPRGIKIPVAVSAFPDEIYQAPQSWAEKAYPKLIFYNRPPKGGHFAAWEQPMLLTADLRAAFKPLRKSI
ncbi:pimeloyl-ACP methyl ester carboxylesterase [Rhizobium sp. BK181]|uniref:alpha/beta fold hydrolase n=1 Tax=Rhizobium sp. BK181 TaxID=2587072 RepID=UPI00160E5DDD|nr:alpha/beta fold hydrolase [Rhizobium sp. BK181]MBB3319750.1 pimeloyl-ACP methyl ester carboxylesterase [Rhizobium sp. BK181]